MRNDFQAVDFIDLPEFFQQLFLELTLITFAPFLHVAVTSRRNIPVFTTFPGCQPFMQVACVTVRHVSSPLPPSPVPPTKCPEPSINLEGNNITVIRADDFEGLNQVQIMQLMENQIHLIEKGAFQDLVSMERLRLNNNRLRSLPDLLFSTMPNLLRL
ncbi:hypothetical protein CDAR_423931 [Caerostris darwini]|uniref:Uncharacterized protein n=1 Tax=Caerostris darwini TaxID=1538125 RepID=A0AAV4VEA6_9ARAC|nr:hypothetical protein CDAR_423931 [Caerostris darwini]